jgi:hypothetical protein
MAGATGGLWFRLQVEMSRSRILAFINSSRQTMIAWKVSGLSHRPAIIASPPASMRLAIAISPSRD